MTFFGRYMRGETAFPSKKRVLEIKEQTEITKFEYYQSYHSGIDTRIQSSVNTDTDVLNETINQLGNELINLRSLIQSDNNVEIQEQITIIEETIRTLKMHRDRNDVMTD